MRTAFAEEIVVLAQSWRRPSNGQVAVTYFEWSASSDQKIIIPKEAIRAKLILEVAGRMPEHRTVPVAEKEPRVSCVGEKIWQDRWGR